MSSVVNSSLMRFSYRRGCKCDCSCGRGVFALVCEIWDLIVIGSVGRRPVVLRLATTQPETKLKTSRLIQPLCAPHTEQTYSAACRPRPGSTRMSIARHDGHGLSV